MAILKPLVIFMAILIFVLFGVVAWRLVTIIGDESAQTAGFAPLSLGLAPSCQITGASLDGNNLLVTTGPATATCNAVFIVDIVTGKVIGNIEP